MWTNSTPVTYWSINFFFSSGPRKRLLLEPIKCLGHVDQSAGLHLSRTTETTDAVIFVSVTL